MPRTSKAMAVLVKREAALKDKASELQAHLDAVTMTLGTVQELLREMQAAPKRTRVKRLVPANTQPATATAA